MGVVKKQLFSAHIKFTFEFETNVLCPCKLRTCVCVCVSCCRFGLCLLYTGPSSHCTILPPDDTQRAEC